MFHSITLLCYPVFLLQAQSHKKELCHKSWVTYSNQRRYQTMIKLLLNIYKEHKNLTKNVMQVQKGRD